MPKVTFKPGVDSEHTDLDVGAGYVDANLIRFRGGAPSPVGGWETLSGGTATGVCRSMHEWSNNSGTIFLALGTHLKAQILCADSFYDITPSDYQTGQIDAATLDGYGFGAYSSGTYGTPRTASSDPLSEVLSQPTIWHLDNFGEDLILNPRGSHIYIWHANGGLGRQATKISDDPSAANVPEFASGIFVNTQLQVVVALGCCPFGSRTPDPMQVRWSSLANPYDWTPTSGNSAGGQRLALGSLIIGWLSTYYETLIWTDKGVYTMQYTADNNVFGFEPIGKGMSMISPQAAVSNGSLVAWMDRGCFYQYAGQITELPCPIKKEVFDNINQIQSWKTFAAHNHSFSEIWWFYPQGTEIDSYVMWNYRENVWSKGSISRTAWSDSGRVSAPVAIDAGGVVYFHETGQDADGSPLPYNLVSGDMDINDGETFILLSRIIPDFKFQKSLGQNQRLMMDVMVRNSSNDPRRTVKTFEITPDNCNRGYLDAKIRGRRVSIRIYNDSAMGTSWVMGKLQAEYSPNGKR